MSAENTPEASFKELGLNPAILESLNKAGYETPSPIQARTIPLLLAGKDLVGQAQTGTGKTAAFALPILNRLDLSSKRPQALILTPTRELAIQVAEGLQRYASAMPGFHVLPLYGGQEYRTQLRQLERGVHVIVGTPGRLMDHMRRGTLNLSDLATLVLDEADEMLRMGFIDDVEWIIQQTPSQRQVALFSATMPPAIRRIAQQYLKQPEEITIQQKTATATTIRQRFWLVSGINKLDALTRIMEAEPFDGMIIFVRTKNQTAELAERLEARGYGAAALNGDIPQNMREKTVERLKSGDLDILVATDVVARGLDVERISHVINYDIPYDTESYVHRIGRTGRAGRKGDAILFVAPRERRMLRAIEKATRQPITPVELPTSAVINEQRVIRFKQRITDAAEENELNYFRELLANYEQENNLPAIDIAARLACLLQDGKPFLLSHKPHQKKTSHDSDDSERSSRGRKREDSRADASRFSDNAPRKERKTAASGPRKPHEDKPPMERFRLAVGKKHGVKAGNIVGAIANEAGIDSAFIDRISIQEDYTTVFLPEGMPRAIFKTLRKTWVCGQQLDISKMDDGSKKASGSYNPAASAEAADQNEPPRKKLKLAGSGSKRKAPRTSGPRKKRSS